MAAGRGRATTAAGEVDKEQAGRGSGERQREEAAGRGGGRGRATAAGMYGAADSWDDGQLGRRRLDGGHKKATEYRPRAILRSYHRLSGRPCAPQDAAHMQ